MTLEDKIAQETAEKISERVMLVVNNAADIGLHYSPKSEVRKKLKIGDETLDEILRSGEIGIVHLTKRRTLIDIRDLNKYLDRRKI
ncbi:MULTISPECIES: hypothetical protein [unclassified Gemella]|uniref:hypothetical protein n=1 Tax=unclassified Gemella TaxID=2624949 RepID=UPI0010741CBF|nr:MULTISPECIES: hypothetical protein [unclassified Gemella]MBF0709757.1 hypothetical protein [Gemella sp. GL1.1]MBF0747275.1 hypothetical protein [Gemella sp. 19428wG2_WT2a]NYS27101.1 hypothetical protein [Gemella sp. GL1]TFU57860.1 hypothetical protein E4T67_06345 [Gemella sp. WT2a]